MTDTIVYRDSDGTIICESCAVWYGRKDYPVRWEDLNDGTEQTPHFCDSCSEPLRVEKF